MSKVQLVTLKCNRCRKQIGKLICLGEMSINSSCVRMIRSEGREPVSMEIVCDECSSVYAERRTNDT